MAPAYAVSGTMRPAFPDFPAEGRFDAMRNASVTAFHLVSIVTVFAFILILTVGAYP